MVKSGKTVLITGANRGIGLALVENYLEHGWTVFACTRKCEIRSPLSRLRRKFSNSIVKLRLDATNEKSISHAAKAVSKYAKSLDLLINNGAVFHDNESILKFDAKKSAQSFATNATGPMIIVKHFIPLLKKSERPAVVNISSISGSLSRVSSFSGLYTYKASKAALNMFSRLLSHELRKYDIPLFILHPGLVKTRLNPKGTISPEESAGKIFAAIEKLGIQDSGKFITLDSKECPW
ncbi:MAG TPA: hypothetical protein DCZ94_09355 [Lentisphaeria bacterium]|nr:MAG: hypothetical protein A2X48_18290 [Lentisphaerae bacterium GWF2_49_21]HBC87147.1 hypothetical protein [Lentisphaeria bacterium]